MVEKEVAKTKRETVNLQVREKTEGKTPSELYSIHGLSYAVFGSYQEDTGTERQWQQYIVKDGSLKTVLIMMTQVTHSVRFVDFPHTTSYVNIFCSMQGFHEILLVKGHYNEKHSFGVDIAFFFSKRCYLHEFGKWSLVIKVYDIPIVIQVNHQI